MIETQKRIYLCRPNGKILTQLNGVDTESVEYGVHVKDFNEISFTVQRYIIVDGKQVETNGYNNLHVGMNILLEDLDMFQIQEPTVSNDGVKEYKTVKGYSLEHEFMEKSWIGLKVNTGEDGSLEYQSKSNLDEFGFSKQYITFYRPNNSGQTEYSLIHRILEKMPGWSVDDADIDGVLRDKKIKIDEDNINLYALLTSVIAPKAECIFLFDTINKKIKAVAKESLDAKYYDTNIFVSMRNLIRTLDVQTNEDSVFTVFNVAGEDDLNIRYVNYNDRYIYDLSYFMSEPWMNQQLIDKIQAWSQWRENNHNLYIEKSKRIEELNDRIYMIDYQKPNDGDDWQQWDEMSLDGLNGAYRMFYAYLVAILVSADDNPTYDQNHDYIIRRNENDEIDEDYYKPRLLEDSLGYYTYFEIKNYILPNIQIAVNNKGEIEEDKRDYVKEYETNWELYGLELLGEKKLQISDKILTLADYEKAWEDMTEEEQRQVNEMSYKTHHQQFVELTNQYDGLVVRQAELEEEKQSVQNQIDNLSPELEELRNKALITDESWGLTEDELELFNILCKYTDYTNSNIVTTSLTTTTSKFENQEELYQDSVSKLSEVSQPQYSFNVDIDNFFDIPEFSAWKEKFHLLRFMRVGIRDDYSVKLRLIGYTTNPCEIDPMLTVEFSNFITSKSGRSDLTELLNLEGGSASSNSISIGKGNAQDAEEFATNLFYMMSRSGMLQSNPRNSASGTATSIFTGVSTANLIDLYTTTGYITDAVMSEAKVTDYLDAVKVNAATLQAGTIIADRILLKGNGSGILYQLNNLGSLESDNMSTLDGYVLTENTVTADKIVANSITAREITTENIEGTNGWINLREGTFLYRNPNDTSKGMSWDGNVLTVAGTITAYDGMIGPWIIPKNVNQGTTAQGGHFYGNNSLYGHASGGGYEYETGMKVESTPDTLAFYVKRIPTGDAWNHLGENTEDIFYVKHSGELYAKNANIEGNITAKSGFIGKDATHDGWTIKSNAIYSGTSALTGAGSTTAGTYIGTDGILNYKDANAYVKISNGSIIANNGNIGDWSITTSGLHYDANVTQASYITNIAPTILQYEFVSNTNSYNSRFYLDMWNFNIVPQLYFINNQGTTHNEGIFSPNQIGFSMTTSSENYTSTYGATGCNIPQMTCTNADIYNNLSVTGTISEGGTALSNKYATIHSHPYLAVRPAFIEMQPSSNAENGGFIDFHYNNSSADYTARIIENSQGVIRITSDTDNNLIFKDALGYYRHPVSSIGDPNRLTCLRTNSESVGIYGMWGVAGTLGDEGRTIACPSSDIRLKKNIKDCVISALPVINSIRMRQFDWKDESRGHWNCGFVVDEMEKDIDPNFSIGGNEENGLITYKSVNTFYLQGYEVKAIQELSQQVTELQSEIQSLKQQLTELKSTR